MSARSFHRTLYRNPSISTLPPPAPNFQPFTANPSPPTIQAVAHHADCVFVNIKASSLYSKWIGESNQNTRAIFSFCTKLAVLQQRVIIFLDEVDALLGDAPGSHEINDQARVSAPVTQLCNTRVCCCFATRGPPLCV